MSARPGRDNPRADAEAEQKALGPLVEVHSPRVNIVGAVGGVLALTVIFSLSSVYKNGPSGWWSGALAGLGLGVLIGAWLLFREHQGTDRGLQIRLHESGMVIVEKGHMVAVRYDEIEIRRREGIRNSYRWEITLPAGELTIHESEWSSIGSILDPIARGRRPHIDAAWAAIRRGQEHEYGPWMVSKQTITTQAGTRPWSEVHVDVSHFPDAAGRRSVRILDTEGRLLDSMKTADADAFLQLVKAIAPRSVR